MSINPADLYTRARPVQCLSGTKKSSLCIAKVTVFFPEPINLHERMYMAIFMLLWGCPGMLGNANNSHIVRMLRFVLLE